MTDVRAYLESWDRFAPLHDRLQAAREERILRLRTALEAAVEAQAYADMRRIADALEAA